MASATNPHASCVAQLHDWASLSRYWLGYHDRPALAQAIVALSTRAAGHRFWNRLAAYLKALLENPLSPNCDIPRPTDDKRLKLKPIEIQTLELLELAPVLEALEHEVETFSGLPEPFIIGMAENMSRGCQIAQSVRELAIEARCLRSLAQLLEAAWACRGGPISSGPWAPESRLCAIVEARKCYERASRLCKQMVGEGSAVGRAHLALTLALWSSFLYRHGNRNSARRISDRAVGMLASLEPAEVANLEIRLVAALSNLAAAQQVAADLEAAWKSREFVLGLCRRLAEKSPNEYRVHWAQALNLLGSLLQTMAQPARAGQLLQEAVEVFRSMPEEQRQGFEGPYLQALSDLGVWRVKAGAADQALSPLHEAASIARTLAAVDAAYRPGFAGTLRYLAEARVFTNDYRGGVEAFAEAADVLRSLGERCLADLGNCLADLGSTQMSLNDPAAVATLEEAVDILRGLCKGQPGLGASLGSSLCSLGMARMDVSTPEEARRNLEEGIALLRVAPPSHQRDVDLAEALIFLARTQDSLGETSKAIGRVGEAIQFLSGLAETPDGRRGERVEHYLAVAYQTLAVLQAKLGFLRDALQNLDMAITQSRSLAAARPGAAVVSSHLARLLLNRGQIYLHLGDIDQAEKQFGEVQQVWEPLAAQRPAIIWSALGEAFHALGVCRLKAAVAPADVGQATPSPAATADVWAVGLANLRRATDMFAQGISQNAGTHLEARMRCWLSLGAAHMQGPADGQPSLEEAREALRQAAACAEALRGGLISPRQRHRIQSRVLEIYQRLMDTCIGIGEENGAGTALEEAVEIVEAVRARNLMELLGPEELRPENAAPELVEEFHVCRRSLRQARQSLLEEEAAWDPEAAKSGVGFSGSFSPLDASLRTEERARRLRQELQQLETKYQRLLKNIQAKYDALFDPDQPVHRAKYSELRQLLAGRPTALVQYAFVGKQAQALVVTSEGVKAIPLEGMGATELRHLAEQRNEVWCPSDQRSVSVTESQAKLLALLELVGERAVKPVAAALDRHKVERIIFSPSRELHLFPLHACPLDGRYLADLYDEISYTPSLSILLMASRRVRKGRDRLCLVNIGASDLPFNELEASAVSRLYSEPRHLRGADKLQFFPEAAACHVLHFTGHAEYNADAPLRSRLILGAGNEPDSALTLAEVFTSLRLPENRLTVISGCESARVMPDQIDEYVGLSSGFLYAGAKCVVSSLWPVDGLPTALLMARFHSAWQELGSPAAALRDAQRWLRHHASAATVAWEIDQILASRSHLHSSTEAYLQRLVRHYRFVARHDPEKQVFAHPYYWAAFIAIGQ